MTISWSAAGASETQDTAAADADLARWALTACRASPMPGVSTAAWATARGGLCHLSLPGPAHESTGAAGARCAGRAVQWRQPAGPVGAPPVRGILNSLPKAAWATSSQHSPVLLTHEPAGSWRRCRPATTRVVNSSMACPYVAPSGCFSWPRTWPGRGGRNAAAVDRGLNHAGLSTICGLWSMRRCVKLPLALPSRGVTSLAYESGARVLLGRDEERLALSVHAAAWLVLHAQGSWHSAAGKSRRAARAAGASHLHLGRDPGFPALH